MGLGSSLETEAQQTFATDFLGMDLGVMLMDQLPLVPEHGQARGLVTEAFIKTS
jgi:hypothetical protein